MSTALPDRAACGPHSVRGALPADLRCPVCRAGLRLIECESSEPGRLDGALSCSCGQSYAVTDGVWSVIYPAALAPSDEKSRSEGDTMASGYEPWLDWLFATLVDDEETVRHRMLDLLELQPGARVLEIGCGTGRDTQGIVQRVGDTGAVVATDLSRGMIKHAQRKSFAGATVSFGLCNASLLPFPDDAFDAVFHFGGINTFGDQRGALAEMVRVTRVGGKVVVGDEGMPPWRRDNDIARMLINWNKLYDNQPPLHLLPGHVQEVGVRWMLGDAFYVIDFRVAPGPPAFNPDVPILVKGDTIRQRYETALMQTKDAT